MIIKKFQEHSIIVHHCDNKEFYLNEDIYNSINYVFSLDKIKNSIDTYQIGMALSTNKFYNEFPLTELPGGGNLVKWVEEKILESAEPLGFTSNKIKFGRTWVNMMFEGCEGACHDHTDADSGVAIFYANVPANSSDIVFIDGGTNNTHIRDYSPEKCFPIKLNSGDLIIHDPLLPHAVSKHNNQEPRICLIFEFSYV